MLKLKEKNQYKKTKKKARANLGMAHVLGILIFCYIRRWKSIFLPLISFWKSTDDVSFATLESDNSL
jgi:hypothetical protein